MNDTVVSDQSGWEEPSRSERLPSTVAQPYNGASVTLWLWLGCCRYSWAMSSASPLLFIHPTHCCCSLSPPKKKKNQKMTAYLLLASLPLLCLTSRQRKYIQMSLVHLGPQLFFLLCLLEIASMWFWFSSTVIGLNERVTANRTRDSNRAQRMKRRVAMLSSLTLWELLSYIQGLQDTATVFLWLRVCMCALRACTPPRTWQEGEKAVTKVLSYVSFYFFLEFGKQYAF